MNFAELFSLEPRALHIWGAFGVFALSLVIEVVRLRARLARVRVKGSVGQGAGQ